MKAVLAILFALSLGMGCVMDDFRIGRRSGSAMTKEEMAADEDQRFVSGTSALRLSYKAGQITKSQFKKRREGLKAIHLQNLRYIYQGRGFLRAPRLQPTEYLLYVKNIKAALQGDARAQFALGEMYRVGWIGQPKELVGAYMWYNIAALNGFLDAKVEMDIINKEMTLEEIAVAERLTGVELKEYPGLLSG